MNEYFIREIVSRLKEAGLVTNTLKSEEVLQTAFSNQICIIWTVEDVLHGLQDHYGEEDADPVISDEDALKVLNSLETYHDANVGISWDTIRIVAEDLADENEIVLNGYTPWAKNPANPKNQSVPPSIVPVDVHSTDFVF